MTALGATGRCGTSRRTRRQTGVRLHRQVTADQIHEAIQLYGEGWSCQRLAERYDCNATTVWKVLQQASVTLRAPSERP